MGFNSSNDPIMTDSFNTKKLRPLVPKPAIAATTAASTTTTTSSLYSTHTQGSDFFLLQDHLGGPEQGKRQMSEQPVSSRWNPTPEQLQVLEDLYRRGIHTPTAEQIRNITTMLRRFGKIEGKNVFYWFQNHKARERQKRRRQAEEPVIRGECTVDILERKESESSRRGFQLERCKSWLSSTNYGFNVEEPASMCREESRREEWLHYDRELQHQSLREVQATWHLSSLSSTPYLLNNSINCNPSIATAAVTTTTTTAPSLSNPEFLISEDFNVDENEWGQSQTLELFPVHSDGSIFEEKTQAPVTPPVMSLTPYHFFEFL